MNDWLANYLPKNVFVFDFYNVLTTNGGNPTTNGLNLENGNHHRWWNNTIQHKTDGDNDSNGNVLEYPSASGNDHPSRDGNLKATGEFINFLNIAYHRWKGGTLAKNKADFDGDGKTDIAIYSKNNGACQIMPSSGASLISAGWGGDPGDIPVVGD